MARAEAGQSRPQVRARVLRAALEAIEEVGPDRVRVQDIARRAGMSSGHVMYYFGDRDGILFSTLMMSEEQLAERRNRAVRAATDPKDAVDRVCRLYLPMGPRDVRWRLWAQAIASPPLDAQGRATLRTIVDDWSSCLAEIIAAGIAEGGLGGSDASATADRLCRYMDGLAMEVLLGAPGHGRAWAVQETRDAWGFLSRHVPSQG
jgi:AcrR family transcriptional regulator